MSHENQIREMICRFGRSLFERGLTAGSSGNISVRLSDGGWLTTPTNSSLGFLDPVRLSRLDADGRLVSGDTPTDRKSTRLNSSHANISYAVFCLKKKKAIRKLCARPGR